MQIDDPARLKQFTAKSNIRAALALARDWGAIAIVITLNLRYPSWYLYLPSLWIIGAFQFALAESMLHEAAHNHLFTRKRWNVLMEAVYAYPFFRTVRQYRLEHMLHHARMGSVSDPLVDDYRALGLYESSVDLFSVWFTRPLTGFAFRYYASTLTLRPYRWEGAKLLAFWLAVLALFVASGKFAWLLKFWLLPLFSSCYAYLYWSEISDHFHTRHGTRSNVNPLTNWITHNNGYHFLHHRYPGIPWFHLKRAYAELVPGQGDLSHGFMDTYRQICCYQSARVRDGEKLGQR